MPVLYIKNEAAVCLNAAIVMTPNGVFGEPTFIGLCRSCYDYRKLLTVEWSRCTRVKPMGSMLLFVDLEDKRGRVETMMVGSTPAARLKIHGEMLCLARLMRRLIRVQKLKVLVMALHPRVGCDSPLNMISDVLPIVFQFLV